jgi:hypothetical protein
MGISGGGPWPYPMPGLSRMMVFADGENIVVRYQDMQKDRKPRPDVHHERDVYAWHRQAVRPDLHHVIRATYYTSVAGDEPKILEIGEKIRSLEFDQYSRSPGVDISRELGNTLSSVILKKTKN